MSRFSGFSTLPPADTFDPDLAIWLDKFRQPLLSVDRMDQRGQSRLMTEGDFDIMQNGTFVNVPYTSSIVYSGDDHLKAGSYNQSIIIYGSSEGERDVLVSEFKRAAIKTRYIQRRARTIAIARFNKINLKRTADNNREMEFNVEYQAALPYYLTAQRSQSIPSNVATPIIVGGDVNAPARFVITAGAQAVTNIILGSGAGITNWIGVINPTEQLVIDGFPGAYSVVKNGVDVRTSLTGPQPYFVPGISQIYAIAGSASVVVYWQEGAY